jgi:hypothetical protein
MLEDTVIPPGVESDVKIGEANCSKELSESGISKELVDSTLSSIKETIRKKHEAFLDISTKMKEVEKSNKVLLEWLEDYEHLVLPRLSDDSVLAEHLTSLHENITKLVKAQTELSKSAEIRTQHSIALGELRHAASLSQTSPSVCIGLQCYLCMDRICDRALVPCGHTICGGCAERTHLYMAKCFVCRAKVDSVLKLFHGAV